MSDQSALLGTSPWHPPPVADIPTSASDALATNPITCVEAVMPSQEDVDKFLDDYYGDRKMEEPKGPFNLILTTCRHEQSNSAIPGNEEVDPPLTDDGRDYAKAGAGRSIKSKRPIPDLTLTSPLRRTMKTAEWLGKAHKARLHGTGSEHTVAAFWPLRENRWKSGSRVTTTDFLYSQLTSEHVKNETNGTDEVWENATGEETGDSSERDIRVRKGRVASTLKLLGYIGKGIHLRTQKSDVRIECVSHQGILRCLCASLEDSKIETATKSSSYKPKNHDHDFGEMRGYTCSYAPGESSWGFKVTHREMVDSGSNWHYDNGAKEFDELMAEVEAAANEGSEVNANGGSGALGSDAADTARSVQEFK